MGEHEGSRLTREGSAREALAGIPQDRVPSSSPSLLASSERWQGVVRVGMIESPADGAGPALDDSHRPIPAPRLWPLTGAPRPPVVPASPEEIRRALAEARTAQPEWASRSLDERFAALERGAKSDARRSPGRARPRQRGDGQARGRGHLHRGPRPAGCRLGVERYPRRGRLALGAAQPSQLPRKARAHPPRPPRRGRRHRSVELPRLRALSLGLSSAALRQRRHPQALGVHAARERVDDRPPRARAADRRGAGGRGRRRRRPPAHRERHRRLRVHRLDRRRGARPGPLRRARHRLQRGDGRQGRGDRAGGLRFSRAPWRA